MKEKMNSSNERNVEAKVMARSLVNLPNVVLILCLAALMAFFSLSSVSSGKDGNYDGMIFLYLGSNYSLIEGEVKNIDENVSVVPKAENGTTLVPLRFIAEQLKYDVEWNQEEYKATITDGTKTLVLVPEKDVMTVDGKEVKLLLPAKAENGRILVPLRAVAEAFEKEVDYSKGLISISNAKDLLADSSFNDQVIRMINVLPEVKSKEELLELLEENGYSFSSYSNSNGIWDTVTTDSLGSANTLQTMGDLANNKLESSLSDSSDTQRAENDDYSKTNTQVEGVDEADVIKTDGKYLYQVNNYSVPRVIIFDITNPSAMKQVSELEFDEEIYPKEIYVDGDKLVVIAEGYERIKTGSEYLTANSGESDAITSEVIANQKFNLIADSYYVPSYTTRQFTKMYVINTADKSNLKIERTSEIEGNYVSSRKIDDVVYLISSKYIGGIYEIMPLCYDTFGNTQYLKYDADDEEKILDAKEVKLNSIRCVLPMHSKSYLTVGAANINSKEEMNVQSFLGAGDNVYASLENLYITSNANGYHSVINSSTNEIDAGLATSNTTDIMKFSLDDSNVTYINKTNVPGMVINQYSMDEHDGYFRIATTQENFSYTNRVYKHEEYSNVFVLDDFLNKVGEITKIAPGEEIYSTRFLGDRLYMVTFKTVDPLFVIDLQDPKSPKILGKLKIPGYSNYLHPYDENHIIGIGQDAEEVKNESYALNQGLKIALFDVTDVENPVQKQSISIGDRGTTSEVLTNPKAFLFSKEKEILALPIELYEKEKGDTSVSRYGSFSYQGMYVYKFNLEEGFKFLYRVTHISDDEYKKSGSYLYDYLHVVDRGLYVGDTLFTSSQGMLKSNSLYEGKEIGSLEITQEEDNGIRNIKYYID